MNAKITKQTARRALGYQVFAENKLKVKIFRLIYKDQNNRTVRRKKSPVAFFKQKYFLFFYESLQFSLNYTAIGINAFTKDFPIVTKGTKDGTD